MPLKILLPAVIMKAVAMVATVEAIVNPGFWQTLVISIVSAMISGLFLLFATHMNTRRSIRPMEEIKNTVEDRLDAATKE